MIESEYQTSKFDLNTLRVDEESAKKSCEFKNIRIRVDGDLKLPNYPENMGQNVREVIGHCGGVSDDHIDAEFWFRILYRIVFILSSPPT